MVYRYLRDPLFIFCLALYFINRLIFKPYLPNEFSSCYLNDLICIPFWIPFMLYGMRKVGLRTDDSPPQSYEILIPLLVWSVVFEIILPDVPLFKGLETADYLDALCYTLGASLAAVYWKLWYRLPRGVNRMKTDFLL